MISLNDHSPTVSIVALFFFFTFQDVAGNSLGLLSPSFPAAIVDSGKCRCKNRFSKIFAERVREYLQLNLFTREHAKRFYARYQHKLMPCCLVTYVLKRRWLNQFLKMGGLGKFLCLLLNTLTSFMTFLVFYRHNRHFIATWDLRSSYSTTQRGKSK